MKNKIRKNVLATILAFAFVMPFLPATMENRVAVQPMVLLNIIFFVLSMKMMVLEMAQAAEVVREQRPSRQTRQNRLTRRHPQRRLSQLFRQFQQRRHSQRNRLTPDRQKRK